MSGLLPIVLNEPKAGKPFLLGRAFLFTEALRGASTSFFGLGFATWIVSTFGILL